MTQLSGSEQKKELGFRIVPIFKQLLMSITWTKIENEKADPLNSHWQSHALVCSGYIELGMLDDAAHPEEIESDDKTPTEVLG